VEECDSRVEMGVKGLSEKILGKFTNLEIHFFNFVNNINESFVINEIFIVNSYHDLIIGRIPICKFDLFNKLKKDICRDCCSNMHPTVPKGKVLNNINSKGVERDKVNPQYTNINMNNLFHSINPEWIEANKLCNLTHFETAQDEKINHFKLEEFGKIPLHGYEQ